MFFKANELKTHATEKCDQFTAAWCVLHCVILKRGILSIFNRDPDPSPPTQSPFVSGPGE